MTKTCFWMLSLASVVALTTAPVTGPARAQARLDPPLVATAPAAEPSQLQGVTALRFDAPAPPQRVGSSQGFGPMPSSPLLGAHPVQSGGGKW
jgi:hypothetical protein